MPEPCRSELNTYITIESQEETRSAEGRIVQEWTTFDKCWAKVKHAPYMSAGELTEHGGDREFDKTIFTIPYIKDVNNSQRILIDEQVYDIVHVNNYMHRNKWLEITTVNKT